MKNNKKRNLLLSLILAAVCLAFLLYVDKFQHYSMLATVLKKGAVYSLVAVSMNLLNGFTGLFSLGQAGFMLLGAYTYAILTVPMALRVIRIAETLSASAETRGIDLKRRKSNYLSLRFSAWDAVFCVLLAASVSAGLIIQQSPYQLN